MLSSTMLSFFPNKATSSGSSAPETETSRSNVCGRDGLPIACGLKTLKLVERLIEAPLKCGFVAGNELKAVPVRFPREHVVEKRPVPTLHVEKRGLDTDRATKAPCVRDYAVYEEEFQFADRRQLSAETFSKIQEVHLALAFHQALAAQEPVFYGVKSHPRLTLWRPRSRAPAGIEAVCPSLPFGRHESCLIGLR
jgi:hypothetical protein